MAEPDVRGPEEVGEEILEVNRRLAETQRELKRELEARRRLEEELRRANELKSVFVANTAHEIRSPMTAVLGAVELLEEMDLDPEAEAELESIRSGSEHLLDLVEDLLDLSAIEAGEVTLDEESMDPRTLAEETLELVSNQDRARGLDLRLDWAPGVPETVLGDPGRLRQVLVNLLSNAVKFTDEGEVLLEGSPATVDGAPGIRLAVRDTGCGIPEDEQEKLFQPFARAAGTADREGTGLGLAITRRIVEAMGGSIDLESAVGQGTTVTVVVPAHPAAAEDDVPAEGDGQDLQDLRVLVVDDDGPTREVTARLLEEAGAEATTAASGQAAAEAAGGVDAVLMDLNLPDADGDEVARGIREERGPDAAPAILAFTGDTSDAARQRVREAGMAGLLAKPLDLGEAVRLLRDATAEEPS